MNGKHIYFVGKLRQHLAFMDDVMGILIHDVIDANHIRFSFDTRFFYKKIIILPEPQFS